MPSFSAGPVSLQIKLSLVVGIWLAKQTILILISMFQLPWTLPTSLLCLFRLPVHVYVTWIINLSHLVCLCLWGSFGIDFWIPNGLLCSGITGFSCCTHLGNEELPTKQAFSLQLALLCFKLNVALPTSTDFVSFFFLYVYFLKRTTHLQAGSFVPKMPSI